jgi:hypothetical protein
MIHIQKPNIHNLLFDAVIDQYSRLFPEHTIAIWDDDMLDEFIAREYEWFLPTYFGYQTKIERIDSARYFILYHYGGLYTDIDVLPLVNYWDYLDPTKVSLVESQIVFEESIQNSLMASPRHHPFWKLVFDELLLVAQLYPTDFRKLAGTKLLSAMYRDSTDVNTLPCEVFNRLPKHSWVAPALPCVSLTLRMRMPLPCLIL